MTPETWPVATSPTTGHPEERRCAICWSPVDGNQCHLHRAPIDLGDIEEMLTVVRQHLVWPEPVTDRALEDDEP